LDQSREKAEEWYIQRINACVPNTKRLLAPQGLQVRVFYENRLAAVAERERLFAVVTK
jgi:hypothetical protein